MTADTDPLTAPRNEEERRYYFARSMFFTAQGVVAFLEQGETGDAAVWAQRLLDNAEVEHREAWEAVKALHATDA